MQYEDPVVLKGKCCIGLSATISGENNFEFIKVSVSYEEEYMGTDVESREKKFADLYAFTRNKLALMGNECIETLNKAKPAKVEVVSKVVIPESKKYKSKTFSEDDF